MTKEQQFIKDLHYNDVQAIPFVELFHNNEDLRNELFQQYLKTEKEPALSLFISSHYTDEEIEKGYKEARNKLPAYESGSVTNKLAASFVFQTDFETSLQDLTNEFYSLSARKEVPKEYYKHSIRRTHLFKKLKKIDERIMDFNLYVTKEKDYKAKEYAEAFTKHLIHELESIDIPLLTKLVLEDFINKEESNQDRFDGLFNQPYASDTAKVNYREITMFAINTINDYLNSFSYKKEEVSIQSIDDESRTRQFIIEAFSNFDKKGWKYAFNSEHDYNLFTDLLTSFFEYKLDKLPNTVIRLKRTCKTKVAKVLGEIHKELSNENKLVTDKEFFKLIRILNHFQNETEGDLYKALTR